MLRPALTEQKIFILLLGRVSAGRTFVQQKTTASTTDLGRYSTCIDNGRYLRQKGRYVH